MSETMNIACPECFAVNRLPEHRLHDAPKCGRCHQPMFRQQPVAVNAGQFRKMLQNNDIPVIVDFWAPWCGPCRMFAPVYEQAAVQLEPQARLIKLDTEAHPEATMPHDIRSIPTLAIFHHGKEVARQSGAMPLNALLDWVKARLPKQAV